jgi:GDP-4-dehydro-6-deoxy-D-mannose reductase
MNTMKSIVITGISGFVGGHYAHYVMNTKHNYIIHGVSRSKPRWDFIKDRDRLIQSIHFHKCDLLDTSAINQIIRDVHPDYILHLAALSSVAESWNTPVTSFLNNTNAFLNIVEAVRSQDIPCKILSVGSSEEYGIVKEPDIPLSENHPVAPANPYAVARVSQEYLAQIYAKGYNLNICCTRSFNHIGPGQQDHFVVSSIAKQFAEIARHKKDPVIKIGAGSIIRDFVDIEDVILAYDALFREGLRGETYNVCSGHGYRIIDIVHLLSELTSISVTIEHNEGLFRPVDNPILVGSFKKIQKQTGWKPQIPIKDSLQKLYTYWCDRLSREVGSG